MYDKYTARPAVFLSCNFIEFSPFYSALNIVFGAPAGYCVPVGLMVAFLQCVKHSIRVPAGYCVPVGLMVTFKGWDFFIFSKILAFSGRLFLCFFEYRNIMCAD